MANGSETSEFVFNKYLDEHVPKQEFKRSLFIGLGGSGNKILTRLKRYFIERYGVVPPSKAFLAIDTDDDLPTLDSIADERGIRLDPRNEFYHLEVKSPLQFVNESDVVGKWLIKPCPTAAIVAGTGAVRMVGRVALFAHAHEVFDRIRSAFDQLRSIRLPSQMEKYDFETSNDAIEVYVCGSIAGGTGSGTFLDIGIFCRENLPPDTMIYGILIGPWIYRKVGATFRTKGNSYAALMELDYMMSVGQEQRTRGVDAEEYRVQYDSAEFTVDQPPFNVVHLVDGQNQHGATIPNANALIEFIAEGLFLSTSANIGGVLRSAVDNILTITTTSNPDLWGGKPAYYSSFGAAAVVYPAKQYVKRGTFRFSCKVLEALSQGISQGVAAEAEPLPADREDVDRFVKLNRLDYDASPTALDHIYKLDTLPKLKLSPPLASQVDGSYPSVLSANAKRKYDRLLDSVLVSFSDPQGRISEAVSAYVKHGSTDSLNPTTGQQRAARLKLLIGSVKPIQLTLVEDIERKAAEVQEADNAVDDALRTIEDAVRSKGLFVSKGKIQKRIEAQFEGLLSSLRLKFEKQVVVERLTAFERALAEADKNVTGQLETAAGARIEGGVLGELAKEALRITRLKSKAVHDFDLDAGISDFEVLLPLLQEVPDDEDEHVKKAAEQLLSELTEAQQRAPLNPRGVLARVNSAAAEYAVSVYDKSVSLLDLIKERQDLSSQSGDRDGETFVDGLMGKLEYKGQPLWHYYPGVVLPERAKQMTSVIIIGAEQRARATELVGDYHFANKCSPNIVGTGERHRLSLIYFAACLPIHALTETLDYQEQYNGLFKPPVHTSRFFELNCESLVPGEPAENLAFRILSIAIIEGIDIISDEKAQKEKAGRYRMLHELVSDPEHPFRVLKPQLGDKFLDAYSYLTRHELVREQVLSQLIERLEQLRRDDAAALRTAIDGQIQKLEKEIVDRKMNKNVTWRCMQREVDLLSRLRIWDGSFDKFFNP